jgi:RsmE family RNA methyltransferase
MNLLLLDKDDLIGVNLAEIDGRRRQHILQTLKLARGDKLKAGLINGNTGHGTIIETGPDRLKIKLDLPDLPAPMLPVTLLLALPRPKMLKRIFQTCAALGVANIYLVNSFRVEKSYWQSPSLIESAIIEQLLLGLEQAGTSTVPQVKLRKRFKPFVEDELANLAAGTVKLVGQSSSKVSAPVSVNKPVTLAIGPEGGFIPYEIEMLVERDFAPVSLGERILRVETAVTAMISRLYT